jgi:hypothetical protein
MKYHGQSEGVLTEGAIMLEELREKNLVRRLPLLSGLKLPRGLDTKLEPSELTAYERSPSEQTDLERIRRVKVQARDTVGIVAPSWRQQ